jgi:hypothetical protein
MANPNVTPVRRWLFQAPAPFVIRCKCVDGEVRTIKVDHASKKKWVAAEAAIDAMGASHVEALDAKGNTIRMMGVEREADPEAEPSAEAKATTSEQKTLEVFARLLAEAYKNGAASTEHPVKMAFDTLGQLLGLMMKRLDDMSARENRQINAALKVAQGEQVTPQEDPLMALVGQFMAGKQAAQALNGAAEGDE